MKRIFQIIALLGFTATPAHSGDKFETPVTAEVLPGWVQADGNHIAALKLTLAPGWKTYWRAPGDAGIPPKFDWSGSRNIHSVSINWPTPKVFDQSGMRSVGYENTLIIPLRLQASKSGAPLRLKADMDLGVCSDICVPYALEFDAEIPSNNQKPTAEIAAALAALPHTASEAGVREATCNITPTSEGLQIEARVSMPSAGNPEHVVIEPGPGDIWVSETDTVRRGNEVIAQSDLVNINGGPIALDRSAIRITVLGSKYAVDIRGCSSG